MAGTNETILEDAGGIVDAPIAGLDNRADDTSGDQGAAEAGIVGFDPAATYRIGDREVLGSELEARFSIADGLDPDHADLAKTFIQNLDSKEGLAAIEEYLAHHRQAHFGEDEEAATDLSSEMETFALDYPAIAKAYQAQARQLNAMSAQIRQVMQVAEAIKPLVGNIEQEAAIKATQATLKGYQIQATPAQITAAMKAHPKLDPVQAFLLSERSKPAPAPKGAPSPTPAAQVLLGTNTSEMPKGKMSLKQAEDWFNAQQEEKKARSGVPNQV